MKRIFYLCLTGVVVALLSGALAQAQSLGDLARQARKEQRPQAKRVVTNDDIAMSSQASAAPQPAAGESSKPASAEAAKDQPIVTPDQAAKLNAEWQAKANEQKKNISQLEREIDVAQREFKLRAAVYYADAGNALRDPKKWAEEDRKYQADMADKQKQLNEAKQKLDDIRDNARKAGAKVE